MQIQIKSPGGGGPQGFQNAIFDTPFYPENIPQSLIRLPQWLVWRRESRNGKTTKVPYCATTGKLAKSNDPATWATFDQALAAYQAGGYSGIGFVFHEGDGLAGIDLDHVIDPETGEVEPWALEVIERFKASYCEVSPSGTGIRIFARGIPQRCGKGTIEKRIELYDHSSPRYLTVTGNHWAGAGREVVEAQDSLDWLHAAYFAPKERERPKERTFQPSEDDRAILDKALKAKNGGKLRALLAGEWEGTYPSQSEADAALCSILAFWTQDQAQLDRIFRGSGLMRDKWDKKHHADGRTYGQATIETALANVGRTYADTLRERAEKSARKASVKAAPIEEDTSWPRLEWRPESAQEAGDTDMGNAQRLFDKAGHVLLFVREVGWHTWNRSRWIVDEAGAKRIADDLPKWVLQESAEMLSRAAGTSNNRDREQLSAIGDKLNAWAKKCEKGATIEAALAMLERRLIVEPTEADRDPFLLAVGNGTINLRTGELKPSKRGDFITKGVNIAFDPDARCPVFEAFLARIFRTHPEAISFIQRAIGYTLTGDTREQCVLILHGNGQNGKSTLVTVIQDLLGDYARQAAPDLLMAKTGDRHPTEIADLRGARLVATVETGEGRRLAESLVKQMSGGDKLKGRYMRRDFFEFDPTFKLWLASNHKPQIKGTDLGIWRRIRLIPFVETIGDNERDSSLPAKLRAELPGILAWAVRGCLDWQRDGLNPPEVVTAATAVYRQEQDILAAFIEECCFVGNRAEVRAEVRAGDLFSTYKTWCERNGERELTQNAFGASLTERGFERAKSTGGARVYRGIGLLVKGASGASGASGSNSPFTQGNTFHSDKPKNRATSATSATFADGPKKWDFQRGQWTDEDSEDF